MPAGGCALPSGAATCPVTALPPLSCTRAALGPNPAPSPGAPFCVSQSSPPLGPRTNARGRKRPLHAAAAHTLLPRPVGSPVRRALLGGPCHQPRRSRAPKPPAVRRRRRTSVRVPGAANDRGAGGGGAVPTDPLSPNPHLGRPIRGTYSRESPGPTLYRWYLLLSVPPSLVQLCQPRAAGRS
jgi:hypothetical protein